MDLELSGKTALVTGGSRGIGRAIALALASEGARVAICARDTRALGEASGEIRRLGAIDILVNNAGAIRASPPFYKTPLGKNHP